MRVKIQYVWGFRERNLTDSRRLNYEALSDLNETRDENYNEHDVILPYSCSHNVTLRMPNRIIPSMCFFLSHTVGLARSIETDK